MKSTRFAPSLAFAGLFAAFTFHFNCPAAPLQRPDVPASPAWVIHLDCDGFRSTSLGQFLLGELDKPEAKAKLAAFQALSSIDLRTQLHGFTLYGPTTNPEDGVLLVYADFDAAHLATLAGGTKDYTSTEYNTHTIHSWVDDKKKHKRESNARVYAAIKGGRVIFGQKETSVQRALDVLDGGPNLASGTNFAQLGVAGQGGFIQGAARKFDLAQSDPNAKLLSLSKQLTLDVAESAQKLTASLVLDAGDADAANSINAMAQGVLAFIRLQKDKPENAKLADAISLKQEGAIVVAALSLPSNDLIEFIKADAARKQKKRAEEQ